jgi:hypothetical protein
VGEGMTDKQLEEILSKHSTEIRYDTIRAMKQAIEADRAERSSRSIIIELIDRHIPPVGIGTKEEAKRMELFNEIFALLPTPTED